MIKAHPWLGVGPEQVGKVYKSYVPADVKKLPTGYYQHLHNVYIHYAAERGVPTMLMLVWMLLRALYDFIRTLRRLPTDADTRWVLHMGDRGDHRDHDRGVGRSEPGDQRGAGDVSRGARLRIRYLPGRTIIPVV